MNMVTMGVAPDLAVAFRALGGFASMGARTVKVTVSKEEDEDHSEEATKEVKPEATLVKPANATVTEVEVTEVKVTEAVKPKEASDVSNITTKDDDTEN